MQRCCIPSTRSESGGCTAWPALPVPLLAPSISQPTLKLALPRLNHHSAAVPFSEMLGAERQDPVRGSWRLPGTKLHRLVIWTFQRGCSNPAAWFPRQVGDQGG